MTFTYMWFNFTFIMREDDEDSKKGAKGGR